MKAVAASGDSKRRHFPPPQEIFALTQMQIESVRFVYLCPYLYILNEKLTHIITISYFISVKETGYPIIMLLYIYIYILV